MRKLYMLALSLFAVSALGVVFVSMASAEETLLASWAVNGTEIAEGSKAADEASSELKLEDTKTAAGAAAILCSEILKGALSHDGADEITEILNSKDELIGELGGLALLGEGTAGTDCVKVSTCAEGSAASPIEVHPAGLPWPALLVVKEESAGLFIYLVLIFKSSYELLCLVLGINTEDTCTATETGPEVLNDPESGDAEFPAGDVAEPLASCSLGGSGTGVTEDDTLALITSPTGLVTVTSELKPPVWSRTTRYLVGAKVEWRANSGKCYEAFAITEGAEPPATPWDPVAC